MTAHPPIRFAIALALVLLAGLPLRPSRAAGQDGVEITSDAVELDVGGRVQTQLNTTTVDTEPDAQLFLRRARVELAVVANDLVRGRLQADFAGERVSIKDAYVQLAFSPGFQVLAGKAYRPFSLLQLTSSTRTLPIERGLSIRGVDGMDAYEVIAELGYAERDLGVQLLGTPDDAPLGLSYQVGIFAPASRSPFQVVGRVTVRPAAQVRVGGAWSNRAFSPDPAVGSERGNAFEVDLELGGFDPGLHFLGEVITGEFDPFLDARFAGAQGWLGYRAGSFGRVSAIEPLVRVSYADIDENAGVAGGTLVTPGINLYLGGDNRVMINYDLWSPEVGGRQGSFKSQVQLVF